MVGENTPNMAYLRYHQQATNSLHPSCNPTSPMEVEQADTLENEEIAVVRTVVRRGAQEQDREERETRRDRERRGHREERGDRDRHRHHRRDRDDRGHERGEDRRQRDRDYRPRYGNPHPRRS